MALKQVARYYSRWDLDNHKGLIYLYEGNNALIYQMSVDSIDEFQLVVGMLRNEKPLWFETTHKHLRTGYGLSGEPVGEEES